MASGMGKSFINLPFVVPPLNTNHKCKIDEHAEMLNSHHFSSLIPSQMEFFTHIERTKVELISQKIVLGILYFLSSIVLKINEIALVYENKLLWILERLRWCYESPPRYFPPQITGFCTLLKSQWGNRVSVWHLIMETITHTSSSRTTNHYVV